MTIEEALFKSTHEALKFAFNYLGQQSPKTPLMSLTVDKDRPPIGSGKGLVGLDAAAQAGMILAEVCRLPDDQHNVIVARYCRVTYECSCCGQDAPREEWNAAIDALSHCYELEGVHRKIRLIMIERAVTGGRLEIDHLIKKYSLSERTLYRQYKSVKTKIREIEKRALINLDNRFYISKLLAA